nr:RNA-directed DNA polymerase, eukaryota [Tanacetum cinerariifolium]GFB43058.1 RNA-directed DNA polymerase, eukaryota [Tanacetum cinerariifolium]
MVGGNSSTIKAWDDTIGKLKARLSNWKLKTLSIGGRLTLLKSVLGSTPIYNMSLYKNTIIWEINVLKSQGIDLISHCKIRVGNGMRTQFWNDTWVGDTQVRYMFPRIYALEVNKDRWVWDLNGEGVFHVKDLRNLLDESFLPKDSTATRWVKSIPIKINVSALKVYLDRLPTRLNLIRRGV